MASTLIRRVIPFPSLSLQLLQIPREPKVKFDDAFVQRRMRAHKAWQEKEDAELLGELRQAVDHYIALTSASAKAVQS